MSRSSAGIWIRSAAATARGGATSAKSSAKERSARLVQFGEDAGEALAGGIGGGAQARRSIRESGARVRRR